MTDYTPEAKMISSIPAQTQATIRSLVGYIMGWVAGHGWGHATPEIESACGFIAIWVWSMISHWLSTQKLNQARADAQTSSS